MEGAPYPVLPPHGAGLALTEVALASLRAVAPRPSNFVQLMVLIAANLVASLVRFIL